MTFLKKHRNNAKQIQLYMSFLEEVKDFDSRLKLITEIGRLHTQNKQIDKMSYEETKRNINDYTIEITAIL